MSAPSDVHAEHAARGELAYTMDATGAAVWPPRVGLAWRVSAGGGSVYSTTMVRRRGEEPQNVALIDVDEGFRVMGRVDGEHSIGSRVTVRFEDGIAVWVPG